MDEHMGPHGAERLRDLGPMFGQPARRLRAQAYCPGASSKQLRWGARTRGLMFPDSDYRETGATQFAIHLLGSRDFGLELGTQYDRLVRGMGWVQAGQPCQKHPSTKTASLVIRSDPECRAR